MAIEKGEETITRKLVEGTARVTLFTDAKTPVTSWRLEAHRESYYLVNGEIDGEPKFGSAVVSRSFAQIAGEKIEVDGKTYTGAEVANVIKAFIDKFRQQDIDEEARKKSAREDSPV